MRTKQQQEALDYFNKNAANWKSKAEGFDKQTPNIIQLRNDFVLEIAEKISPMRSFLDVGCGSGELVCNISKLGVRSLGVDFAKEMIDLAKKKASVENLTQASFERNSIFDLDLSNNKFDLISANGFIEYISHQEMIKFFDFVADALRPGGSFVFSSRNRLFNLISMNDFTLQEIESGSLEALLKEAVRWNAGQDLSNVPNNDFAEFQDPQTKHSKTGINVATRFQYTPFQLISLLNK
jgi:2-polyprenyl-3-methyl-5-hydroxy-6-metoxy-1,4-benzoquinol methylase